MSRQRSSSLKLLPNFECLAHKWVTVVLMTMQTKAEIFNEQKEKYWQAGRKGKAEILDAVCLAAGITRKAAIRKFRAVQKNDAAHRDGRGRKTVYGPDVTAALKTVWEAGNRVCGELLHPMVDEYIDILLRDGDWKHEKEPTELLRKMSEATVKRRIGHFTRIQQERHGISSTKPSHLKHLVPIFTGPWKGKPPGYGQIDTVRHSNSAFGDAVYTTNYTDAATLTPMLRAQWNKSQEATQRSMAEIKERLPFPLLGAHPDTGSEFINRFVIAWCALEKIEFTRSRPNRKNDNMYVEERNGHVVRDTVGYVTLDCPEAVDALNAVYDVAVPYRIHFIAVRRMEKKERVGAKYRITYEKKAMTPYRRIMAHDAVSDADKAKLKAEHGKLNPLTMKNEVEKRVRKLYDVQKRCGKSRN